MGAIIGRGGSRITEIRHRSTQEIKIHEQEENSQNRRITVSGSKELIGGYSTKYILFLQKKLKLSKVVLQTTQVYLLCNSDKCG